MSSTTWKALVFCGLLQLACTEVEVLPIVPTTCSGVPDIVPNPIPELRRGQSILLTVHRQCLGGADFVWRTDNGAAVVSMNPAFGDTVRLTAINNGGAKITVFWDRDSTYRAVTTAIVSDNIILTGTKRR